MEALGLVEVGGKRAGGRVEAVCKRNDVDLIGV